MMTVLARRDLRRHQQLERGVLELHRDTVLFGDDLNRNLEALRDFRLLVVLRGHARRRQNLDLALVLERRRSPCRGRTRR